MKEKDILNTTYYKETFYYKAYLINLKELSINLKENGYYQFKSRIWQFDLIKQRFILKNKAVLNNIVPAFNIYQDIPLNTDVINALLSELKKIPNPMIYNKFQYSKVPPEYKTDFETLKEILLKDGMIKGSW